MRRVDVVALTFGLLMTGTAAGSLWITFTGTLNWSLLRVLVPLGLVVIGALGLLLSRSRS
ncbi:MAG TPA: hypothetical protein VEQ66_12240 [Propionibacteriaceae bacterium]|nr:hypothetical protein [Propionibacteriaceae bacterium]